MTIFRLRLLATSLISIVAIGTAACKPQVNAVPTSAPPLATATVSPTPDLSGRTRFGNASFYGRKSADRAMADGSKLDPESDNAASKTLPLGTTATVTNLKTGQSAVVIIRDRDPYESGPILDLSRSSAEKIGITPENGVARVKVAPISVPLPDGSTRGPAEHDQKGPAPCADIPTNPLRRIVCAAAAMMWVR